MRVVVCWAGMQGYIAASLRALAKLDDVELTVIHLDFLDVPSQEELLAGVANIKLLASDANEAVVARIVEERQPHVVLICGWFYRAYRELVRRPALADVKFVMAVDTPWTGTWRQQANRLRLRALMRDVHGVLVAGSKSRELVRRLGTPDDRIQSGLYAFDFERFEAEGVATLDVAEQWPRRFLFAGRYAPEKGLAVLLEAYASYRSSTRDPWTLTVCGTGPEASRFVGVDGVRDLGYVQPSALAEVFAAHGVFVMPSLEEPWGVAILEAAATGLPLICSDACGAAEQVLRVPETGHLVRAGDASGLSAALAWMHDHQSSLRSMGQAGRRLASACSATAWAVRQQAWFLRLMSGHESATVAPLLSQ
jgi:glycosyltransferase involved in cell wall biosynthesis